MRMSWVCVVSLGAAVLAVPAGAEDKAAPTDAEYKLAVNNLKQIGLAFHNHHDVQNALPRNIEDRDGKPLLSWRVAILPYVEEDALYKQFKLDEPWDSDNNKKLIEK